MVRFTLAHDAAARNARSLDVRAVLSLRRQARPPRLPVTLRSDWLPGRRLPSRHRAAVVPPRPAQGIAGKLRARRPPMTPNRRGAAPRQPQHRAAPARSRTRAGAGPPWHRPVAPPTLGPARAPRLGRVGACLQPGPSPPRHTAEPNPAALPSAAGASSLLAHRAAHKLASREGFSRSARRLGWTSHRALSGARHASAATAGRRAGGPQLADSESRARHSRVPGSAPLGAERQGQAAVSSARPQGGVGGGAEARGRVGRVAGDQ